MNSNDNTAAQTLLFPIQQRETDSRTSDDELVLQTRLVLINALNEVAAGRRILSEEEKNAFRIVNKLLIKYNYPSLYFSF
jgi:hypothetical protein